MKTIRSDRSQFVKSGGSSLVAAVTALSITSCTAFLDLQGDQCDNNSDCQSRGAQFQKFVCNTDKICVPPTDLGCTTNKQCSEVLGAPAICKAPGTNTPCTKL